MLKSTKSSKHQQKKACLQSVYKNSIDNQLVKKCRHRVDNFVDTEIPVNNETQPFVYIIITFLKNNTYIHTYMRAHMHDT